MRRKSAFLLLTAFVLSLDNPFFVQNGVREQLIARRLRSAEDSYIALQDKLLEHGIFREPITVDGQLVKLSFADSSLATATEVADVLLSSEEKSIEAGKLSEAETRLVQMHREHFEAFAKAIQRILARNPWSVIVRDAAGKIAGFVFSALLLTNTKDDLPATSVEMSKASERGAGAPVNTYVDFWFTGNSRGFAEAAILASFQTARALKELGEPKSTIKYVYAYSNPRGLPNYPQLSAEEYAEKVKEAYAEWLKNKASKGPFRDPAIFFHLQHGATLVRIIPNAFPVITVAEPSGVPDADLTAIGRGYAFIMQYPLSVWGK